MPEHTETLREIAEGMEHGGGVGYTHLPETCSKCRIEKLLASADVDLVKKWNADSKELEEAHLLESCAAVEECAKELETWLAVNLPRIKDDARTEQDAKWTAALGFSGVLGPETVAKQVAHEKTEARLEEMKWLWQKDFVDAYNGGLLTEKGRDVLRERIASLAKGAGQ